MMATRKPQRSRRHDWPPGIVFQLCCSTHLFDFFRDGVGNGPERFDVLREAWSDPEIRRQVYDHQAQRNTTDPPAAEIIFGKRD
jgi:hypothetical protein